MSKKHKGQMLTIQGKQYPVVDKFTVLRHLWEMDGYGYVVLDGDKRRIVLTSHERPYFATEQEIANALRDMEMAAIAMRTALLSVV